MADSGPARRAAASLLHWIDARLPLSALWRAQTRGHRVPDNFNVWYLFGSLALAVFVIQYVTGFFLAMHYKPDASLAFDSVEAIRRDVPWGWLLRDVHAAGASAFFAVVYLHMFRGLLYGSYRKPRELVWLLGCALFVTLIAEAFCGYLLPWGQMSYWGAQVIVNLIAAIPWVGPDLALWLRGDYVVGDATLNRFFAFHVIALPLLLIGLIAAHVVALQHVGSNNPEGVDAPHATVPFHPYYTVHDLFGLSVFLCAFAAVVFFAPDFGGLVLEPANFTPADPLRTPAHIAPVWYLTPFYAMLRATTATTLRLWALAALAALLRAAWRRRHAPRRLALLLAGGAVLLAALLLGEAKTWGVAVLGGSIASLFALPWLDRAPQRSMRWRPRWHLLLLLAFVLAFIALAVVGSRPPGAAGHVVAVAATFVYFGFLGLMPWWSRLGRCATPPATLRASPRAGR